LGEGGRRPGEGLLARAPAKTEGCLAFADWLFTPEGGLIHFAERIAVIADVHLGYEWARGAAGDCVPAHSLAETIERLERLLGRSSIDRLVVAGDLVEPLRPCPRTARDLARLAGWLKEREIEMVLLRGNHDRSLDGGSGTFDLGETLVVAGWTIMHGDRPVRGARSITGHQHPSLRIAGRSAPCFLVGWRWIVLPAFSGNAAGLDVTTIPASDRWRTGEPRCIASAGEELLDFGPLEMLRDRLRR
jgi:putative SbcD/Mre11-related phosphoesterase